MPAKSCQKTRGTWDVNTALRGYLPWWPGFLDCGALINVEAPGCGTSVVRGPTGHK